MSKPRYRYLLGDSHREAARLRYQAKLWDPVAHALFDRLKIRRGWKVLEVGPGQGSLHLELRRRVRAPVDFVERSKPFHDHLTRLTLRDGFGPGQSWNCDLSAARLPAKHYDLIFCRWVFLFLPDPLAHIKQLARALKPGGRLAIEDYHRETFALLPKPENWNDLILADRAFFATQGGDASIGGKLPSYFKKAGLKLTDLTPNIKMGRPGSPVWTWASTYFLGIMPRLGKIPPFSPAKAAKMKKAWLAAAKDRSSLIISPTVLDVVGRRPF